MNMQKFTNKVEHELAKRNMKPVDIAKRGNISRSTVSRFLNGQQGAGDDLIAAVSKAFDVPVTEVYRWAGKIPPVDERDEWTSVMLYKMAQLEDSPFLRRLAEKYLDSLISESQPKKNASTSDVEKQAAYS